MRTFLSRAGAALPLVLALAAVPAAAQVRAVTLASDNDAYDFWIPMDVRPDWDYSNGVALSLEMDGAPLWGRLVRGGQRCGAAGGTCLSTRIDAGQKIFTPRVDAAEQVPGERPYAGWLYLSGTASAHTVTTRRALGVEIGVTGPPSLGETVHTTYHRVAGFWEPMGWDGQLRFEPGIVLRYDQAHLLGALATKDGVRLAQVSAEWGASAGNVLTEARGGAAARVGWGVPHPWRADEGGGAPRLAVYALGAVRQRAVARNLFLEGNTFGGGAGVEPEPWVRETELGAGMRVGALTFEYRATRTGREYRTQQTPHTFSTLAFTWRLPTRARLPEPATPRRDERDDVEREDER